MLTTVYDLKTGQKLKLFCLIFIVFLFRSYRRDDEHYRSSKRSSSPQGFKGDRKTSVDDKKASKDRKKTSKDDQKKRSGSKSSESDTSSSSSSSSGLLT